MQKIMHEKTIAVLKIANLYYPFIALVGVSKVTRAVRLRCHANDLYASTQQTYDVSFMRLASFFQGVSF